MSFVLTLDEVSVVAESIAVAESGVADLFWQLVNVAILSIINAEAAIEFLIVFLNMFIVVN
jgi:hypothetical protein